MFILGITANIITITRDRKKLAIVVVIQLPANAKKVNVKGVRLKIKKEPQGQPIKDSAPRIKGVLPRRVTLF